MTELKRISAEAIPHALQKAERYRLLNQPWATESICLDILEVEPANQVALVMLLLSLTDQFGVQPRGFALRAHNVIDRLTDPYQRAYYDGIIHERLAHAQLHQNVLQAHAMAGDSLRTAMHAFEQAEALRQPGDDDSMLRWNTCARTLDTLKTEDDTDGEATPTFGE